MATTELATIDKGAYLALTHSPAELQELIADNLGDDEITERDLPRIGIPAAGGTRWTVPGPAGETLDEELRGIVVMFKRTRQYWSNPDPSGEPPQCKSPNARTGYGNPGGDCKTCPFSQFGSHPKGGNAQACTERELWFMLREGSLLPTVVSLSPTSLDAAKSYRVGQLASVGIQLTSVVTGITLRAETGPGGKYAIAVPRLAARLDPEAAKAVAAYAAEFRPVLERAAEAMANEAAARTAAPATPTPTPGTPTPRPPIPTPEPTVEATAAEDDSDLPFTPPTVQ